MRAERTFWEKATAIHVFCAQGEFRGGDRFARHWHDVTRLDAAGFAAAAIADKALARAVADHKSVFFAEKNTHGDAIDYHAAVAGGLQLVPDDGALAKLATDYQHMVDDGLFLDDAEPFEALMERCQASHNEIQLIHDGKNSCQRTTPILTGRFTVEKRPLYLQKFRPSKPKNVIFQ